MVQKGNRRICPVVPPQLSPLAFPTKDRTGDIMYSQMHGSNNLHVNKFPEIAAPPPPLPVVDRRSGEKTSLDFEDAAIFETDQYGFITSWSAGAQNLYGYETYDMIGKHLASLYTVGELMHGKLVHELLAAESRGAYFSFGWQKRDNGQEFWAYTELEAIRGVSGELIGYRRSVVETPAVLQPARSNPDE